MSGIIHTKYVLQRKPNRIYVLSQKERKFLSVLFPGQNSLNAFLVSSQLKICYFMNIEKANKKDSYSQITLTVH